MSRANEQRLYALVGFSEELDRRPLRFIEPIPPVWVCSLCGVLPRTSGILPCGHCLCKPCYRLCASEDVGPACPLDCDTWPPEDAVSWKDVPFESLLKKQVKCWNEENGCRVVTAASQLSRHYHHVCQYHSTCCPRCSEVVLSVDICVHLVSQCGTHAVSRARKSNAEHGTIQQAAHPRLPNDKPGLDAALGQNSATTASIKVELEEMHSALKVIVHCLAGFQKGNAGMACSKQMFDGYMDDMKGLLHLQNIQLNELVHGMFTEKGALLNAFCLVKEELLNFSNSCGELRKKDEQQMAWLPTFAEVMHSKVDNLKDRLEGLSSGINSAIDRLNGFFQEINSFSMLVKRQSIQMDQLRATLEHLFIKRNSHGQELDEILNKRVTCNTLQGVEDGMGEVKFALERLFIENNHQSDKLGEIFHRMDVLTETLSKQLGSKDSYVKSMLEVLIVQSNLRNERQREFSFELNQLSKQLGTVPQGALQNSAQKCDTVVNNCSTTAGRECPLSGISHIVTENTTGGGITVECTLDGYSSLKEAATNKGRSSWDIGRQVVGTCQISLGVLLRKQSDSVSLHICIQLHRGSMDVFLERPASIEMAVLHPMSHEKKVLRCQGIGDAGFAPVDGNPKHVFSQRSFILLKDLEDASYIRSDQLRLRFTMLPTCANKEAQGNNRKPRRK